MGTTLTGTTPQDTYDSLIKVTDNGPLSGTAKYLSDGLGNDSVLALSTTALGIGTTSLSGKFHAQATNSGIFFDLTTAYTPIIKAAGAISDLQIESVGSGGNLILGAGGAASIITFFTNGNSSTGERMRITSAGTVGIGVTPSAWNSIYRVLQLDSASISSSPSYNNISVGANVFYNSGNSSRYIVNGHSTLYSQDDGIHAFYTAASGTAGDAITFAEKARIDSDGLKFNGDTAAANALDDYEEGTWTMGVSFGGASVGVTTTANTGTYTKIGRQVTVNGYLKLSSKGSSTGIAFLTGLPFTVGNTAANFGAASLWFDVISYANQFQGRFNQNLNYIELEEITILGVTSNLTNADFADSGGIMVSATYFV